MINTQENGELNLTDFETQKRSVKIVLDSASFLMRGKVLGYLTLNIT